MTYNVFGGTLNLAQSTNARLLQSPQDAILQMRLSLTALLFYV